MDTSNSIVLDLETQKSFDEVDGRRPALLKVSMAGVYQYATDEYLAFTESDLPQLELVLQRADLCIGFNIRKFDLAVLAPYYRWPVDRLPTFDILEEVTKLLGHRVSLDSLASATLGTSKTGSGLDALRYFREGRIEELRAYCLNDVKLTKLLYDYGREHGEISYHSRYLNKKITIPVRWNSSHQKVVQRLEQAFAKHLQVDLVYFSGGHADELAEGIRRRVDVYDYDGTTFEGYCHLRGSVRRFQVDRVVDARLTFVSYTIPADYAPAAATSPIATP